MMEPTRGMPTDDAVVSYLRDRAPGLPASPFDPKAVTTRARVALRRRRRRYAVAGAATACLVLLLAGPLIVPGLGGVGLLGGGGGRPSTDRRQADVDRLEVDVVPVVERLALSYYLSDPGCRVLEYPRGRYRDGNLECADLVPFDAQARADFDEVTEAVARSGVRVERIFRQGGVYVQIEDDSWQYNWEYVYLPFGSPPATSWPGEEWTHLRDDWWLHRAHDD